MSLISYSTLFWLMKAIFILFIALWLLAEFLQWRASRRWPRWLMRDMYIDAEPEPDSRSSLETFSKIVPREQR